MRCVISVVIVCGVLAACKGGNGMQSIANPPPPTANVATLSVDPGPAASAGAINHAYLSIKVCAAGNAAQCATIDHIRLDSGSVGLRIVRSVATAAGITLAASTDAQERALEECVTFGGGQTWGPVARADVSIAGERAANVPIQIMDDTASGAPPPAPCGANGTLINGVDGFAANGVLGVGVFAQDCGPACAGSGTPPPFYYACDTAGVCAPANMALADQVANPIASFAADNNGLIVSLPNLVNANGDSTVQGEVIFGLATQSDNSLPAGLVVLTADSAGDFHTSFDGSTVQLSSLIDSGTDSYAFNAPGVAVCAAGAFIGYYCPAVAPQSVYAVNTGGDGVSNRVDFAIADPNTFVSSASAFIDLAGGAGSTSFTWGMPFFYGRKVYFGIEQRTAGPHVGPFYAY